MPALSLTWYVFLSNCSVGSSSVSLMKTRARVFPPSSAYAGMLSSTWKLSAPSNTWSSLMTTVHTLVSSRSSNCTWGGGGQRHVQEPSDCFVFFLKLSSVTKCVYLFPSKSCWPGREPTLLVEVAPPCSVRQSTIAYWLRLPVRFTVTATVPAFSLTL
ncbi:hypothetical protein EYF80_043375 [Liparis tanakae]|uniref:Uncharacterized protein n=1 Tax=Liparis tanakae TaxID=230148 RepID=A0A4Z2FYS2_9TELE|nr:hypothetical protein EYF80_043375 [Liparis tanakae]